MKFVDDCARHHSVKQLQLSPRLLEVTKTIRVENLPPGADDYNLKCLFENPLYGGGRIARIQCLPEESSALIEFFDKKGNIYELDIINLPDIISTVLADLNSYQLSSDACYFLFINFIGNPISNPIHLGYHS